MSGAPIIEGQFNIDYFNQSYIATLFEVGQRVQQGDRTALYAALST